MIAKITLISTGTPNMGTNNPFWIQRPENRSVGISKLPATRSEALSLLKQHEIGPGRYYFGETVNDPEYGAIELHELGFDLYENGQWAMVQASRHISLSYEDVATFLNQVAEKLGGESITLSLTAITPDQSSGWGDNDAMLTATNTQNHQELLFVLEHGERTSLPALSDIYGSAFCVLPSFRAFIAFFYLATRAFQTSGEISLDAIGGGAVHLKAMGGMDTSATSFI